MKKSKCALCGVNLPKITLPCGKSICFDCAKDLYIVVNAIAKISNAKK